MALTLKPNCYYRPFITLARNYCEKSIYQRNEEGTPPRTAQGKLYPDWRKPWIQRDGEWKSKLSVFIEKNPSPDIMNAFSQVPDLTFSKIKEWWKSMKVLQEIHNQKFLPERVSILGSNLAAMHFFIYRHAALR